MCIGRYRLRTEVRSEDKNLHFPVGSAFESVTFLSGGVASDMKPSCSVVATSLVLVTPGTHLCVTVPWPNAVMVARTTGRMLSLNTLV